MFCKVLRRVISFLDILCKDNNRKCFYDDKYERRNRRLFYCISFKNLFENQSLARFKALNRAYNSASEEAVKSKARLDAVNKAIRRGSTVVPAEDKKGMRVLELRLQQLREQLAAFDKRYTREYLALNPRLNVLPKQIRDLEKEIRSKRHFGQNIALSDAQQGYEAARQSLGVIKKQLEDHKHKASDFSSRFAEQEALLSDLEGLEILQRTTQERLVKIEAKQAEKFPQVKIIERAFQPRKPFSPNYTLNAIIALTGSIVLALFCVWTVEYLTRKEGEPSSISITGLNMYANATQDLINNHQQQKEQLTANTAPSLAYKQKNQESSDIPQELSLDQLNALLENADLKSKQLIALLLSGLTLEEISLLTEEHIDFTQETLSISGDEQRTISLNSNLIALFKQTEVCPAWIKNKQISIEMFEAILGCSSIDAGFTGAPEINANSISYTYIIFLVKQGLRLSELEQIIGYTDPSTLLKYSRYSPLKKGLLIADINAIYPANFFNTES